MSEKLIDISKLSQGDIARIITFCNGCDFFVNRRDGNVIGCSSPTKTDSQKLSAEIESCLDAQKDGKPGTMSDFGFCRIRR